MTLSGVFAISFIVIGAIFSLIAAVGTIRMPDLYMRMQSATKAGTLGVACVVIAAAIYFGTILVIVEAVLIVVFLFITAPVASHLIARAAYHTGVPLWEQTDFDEFTSNAAVNSDAAPSDEDE